MTQHPFTRTSVVITAIVSGAVILAGIIGIVAFVPDAAPRVSSILTITIPTCLIALVGVAVSVRNGKIVNETHDTIKTVQQQTNGVTSKLLAHALGTETLDTSELQTIAEKVNKNAQGGQ